MHGAARCEWTPWLPRAAWQKRAVRAGRHTRVRGTDEWRFRGALQLELVHWQTAQISAHLQAHRGGCGIGRDHAHAPNHARVLAGRWRRRWARRCGDAWRTCGQNVSTAEGVPARRSSRGGIISGRVCFPTRLFVWKTRATGAAVERGGHQPAAERGLVDLAAARADDLERRGGGVKPKKVKKVRRRIEDERSAMSK